MNFSEEIINVLDYLGGKMGIAIDWTHANVLPYVEQLCAKYIQWEIATSIIWIVLHVFFIIFIVTAGFKLSKKVYDEYDDFDGNICYVLFSFIIFIFGCGIITQILDITKCVCFPEMQIYEYITSLMRNAN